MLTTRQQVSPAPRGDLRARWISAAAFAVTLVLIYVFLKLAWVGDDAYISFRSLEQLFDGNGARWNVHERVQVYTSPLWFWLLAALRLVSHDVFLNAIILSAAFFLATLLALKRALTDRAAWLVAMLLLVASNAFFDFTTSGLENGMCYFALVMFIDAYRRATQGDDAPCRRRAVTALLAWLGVLLLCRHDLLTIALVPAAYAAWICRNAMSPRRWLLTGVVVFAPFVLWTLISLVYYGAPLPNSAYAKINTGMPVSILLGWGADYFVDSLLNDTVTAAGILVALIGLLVWGRVQGRVLAIGIVTNLVYITWVGGDFMRGRFYAFSYLACAVGTLLFTLRPLAGSRARAAAALAAAALICALVCPHTPLNSPRVYKVDNTNPAGIIDERGFYWEASLTQYLNRAGEFFPDHRWAQLGREYATRPGIVPELGGVGCVGYFIGTDRVILDKLGVTDPLLARLPALVKQPNRPGHFFRPIPAGYRQMLRNGGGRLADPALDAYYQKLRIITQGENLLEWNRLKTIAAMNLGLYDHYLDAVKRSSKQ